MWIGVLEVNRYPVLGAGSLVPQNILQTLVLELLVECRSGPQLMLEECRPHLQSSLLSHYLQGPLKNWVAPKLPLVAFLELNPEILIVNNFPLILSFFFIQT
jgi:hypothetical protein